MKKLSDLFFFSLTFMAGVFATALVAQTDANAELRSMAAKKIQQTPVIDGDVLGEDVWQQAEVASDFWQTTPDEGEAASERTEVRVLFTEQTLYIGAVCYDRNPDQIIVSDSRRDASLNDTDAFQVVLDTYNDNLNGFLFGTNPAGIEYDAQISNEGDGFFDSGSGGFNLDWDAAWEVRAAISEIGWSAEFAIPFKTLRFTDQAEQQWGINFQRNIRRRNERSFWIKLPRQFDIQRISLAGELTGLQDLHQNNLKFIPYVLSDLNRDFANSNEYDTSGDVGFDIKYSLTSSLTLDATYNTDFAQVEADELQINLDRFSLFFPEKRPFFLENAGLFSVGNPGEAQLFFSRRIGISDDGVAVPIVGGLRMTGKPGGVNVGVLNMQTDSVGDSVTANNFAVGRVSKELPNRSSIGALFVNRQATGDLAGDDNYNRTMAVDARVGIGQYALLSGFASQTITPGVDSDEYAYKLDANYNSEAWLLSASLTEVADNFNPEVGFLRRSGYRNPTGLVFYRIRPKDFMGFQELRPHVSYRGFWDLDGFQESGFLHVDNHWEWKNGYELHTGINFTREGVKDAFEISNGVIVPSDTYDHAEALIVFWTNEGAWWNLNVRTTIGGFFGGNRIATRPRLRFRYGEQLNAELSVSHNNIDLPGGDFIANLWRARLSYSFTPKVFIQALVQYSDRTNDLGSLNLRFGWQRTANTGLFLVYNDTRFDEGMGWNEQFRGFIIKYSHLFDLLR